MSPVQTRAGASTDVPKRGLNSPTHNGRQEAQKVSDTKKDNDGNLTTLRSNRKDASLTDAKRPKLQGETSEKSMPEIVEMGILYYFIRGRVEIDEPKSLDDIARGYLIMRPLPKDTDLTERPLPDGLTVRLLALPKKRLPQSVRDRFMAFVDGTDISYSNLTSSFLSPREYETKTAGMRHVPNATPVGEGVYAIIQSENETHLAYISTLPENKSELQQQLGFHERGSFLISTKNPKFGGPAYARLPTPPEYPHNY
ncbi:hypothetical protein G3M48_008551 [Beauveria asiatica]|uniref:Uncharacterized protein n=1 Tax=Beauveria asiatica TaxID=1069075 RepID=A0AAW0RKF5_9HYPO